MRYPLGSSPNSLVRPTLLTAAIVVAGQVVSQVMGSQTTMADEVYKTVDAQGGVVYSDHPLSPASTRITIQVSAPDPEEAARAAKEQAMLAADAAQEAQQAQHAAEEQKKQAAQDMATKQKCDAARVRYAIFAAGGRIYKSDDQGNRDFYSDEEIEQQRTAAKAAMDSACPG
jgi:hypothetical protein